jgi:hypothetical protein
VTSLLTSNFGFMFLSFVFLLIKLIMDVPHYSSDMFWFVNLTVNFHLFQQNNSKHSNPNSIRLN